jgi:DNA-binding CsgD family transcriptional regulator
MRPLGQVHVAVSRHCARRTSSRALRVMVLADLRDAIPFDWHVWLATDPRSGVGVDPVAEVPDLRLLPSVVRLKYATSLNRWTGLHTAVSLGDRAEDSRLWREVQQSAGVVDVASVAFRDRFGCWGFLDLWSTTAFRAEHLRMLTDLAPLLTGALRERQAAALHLRTSHPRSVEGPAVVTLDDSLCVTGMTPAASLLLSRLLPRDDGGPTVPAVAYNVAAQLLAREAGCSDAPSEGRVHLGAGHWVTARASRLAPERTLAVSLEMMSVEDRFDLCARAFALSPREAEVVAAVTRGAASAEIGHALSISVNTVQDHLKSIFRKTGVRSRRELVPLMTGVGL